MARGVGVECCCLKTFQRQGHCSPEHQIAEFAAEAGFILI